jgi:hypothetical protein
MTRGTQPLCRKGRVLARVGEDLVRDGWGRRRGEAPLKGGRPPLMAATPSHSPPMHCAFPPSEPPDGERLRCFRPAVVGGAQLGGSWHLSAIVRLQGFSSGSLAASPHRWSPKMVTTSSMVGRSKPGCGLRPAFSFEDLHHPCRGGGRAASGVASAWVGDPFLPPASGGGNHPPALQRRLPPAMPGKANCCCPARAQHSVLFRAVVASRTGGSPNTSYVARAVLMFWDGPALVLMAGTGARTCRCALGQPTPTGAVLADRSMPPSVLRWWRSEKVSLPTRSLTPPAPPDLRPPGMNGWFSSFVGESLSAAASARRPLPQLSCRPRRR